MKIGSWNVNSINVRLEHIKQVLLSESLDVLALQETKVVDDKFPAMAFEEMGYHVYYTGEKKYNGVAFISKEEVNEKKFNLFSQEQRRFLAITIGPLHLVNVYVPNGQSVGSEKYAYKLSWLDDLQNYLKDALGAYQHVMVMGDFNIAPADIDVYNPEAWQGHVLVSDKEREAFQQLLKLGLHDVYRHLHPEKVGYTWWDYRQAAFRRNMGLRIDHILASSELLGRCQESHVHVEARRWEKPSDHALIWVNYQDT